MIAMTTRSSMSVKPRRLGRRICESFICIPLLMRKDRTNQARNCAEPRSLTFRFFLVDIGELALDALRYTSTLLGSLDFALEQLGFGVADIFELILGSLRPFNPARATEQRHSSRDRQRRENL